MKKALVFIISLACAASAFATALTADRDTPSRSGDVVSLTVKNDEVIYAGSLVSRDASGEALSATDTAAEYVIGRATKYVDNADDGEVISVERGVFQYVSATNAITDASIGTVVYVVDDQTVGRTNEVSNNCEAGRVIDVDGLTVWIDTRDQE